MKLGRFLTTLGIGALAGMLLAPKKGSELREELKGKGKETLDSAKEMTVEDYQKLAEPLLIEIFKAAIEANLAVELNAKSFVKYNNQHLYEYAIPLYISLGGKLFTLGSDAHVAEDYELGFEEMGALLKKHGVTQLATFKKQEMTLVDF